MATLDELINSIEGVSGGVAYDINEIEVIQGGVATTVWTSNPKIILNDTLQAGINRNIISTGGVSVEYPSVTSVIIQSQGYYDDGENDIDAHCTMRYDKPIKGNGKTLYVQSEMANTGYEGLSYCAWKVQLVDVSIGAVTTLGQYNSAYASSGFVVDGVPGDKAAFDSTNNVLTGYTLPSSGEYYFQIRYFAHGTGQSNRYVNCYLHNIYVG